MKAQQLGVLYFSRGRCVRTEMRISRTQGRHRRNDKSPSQQILRPVGEHRSRRFSNFYSYKRECHTFASSILLGRYRGDPDERYKSRTIVSHSVHRRKRKKLQIKIII
ncbi:hypothetical protein CLF_105998 [Clonorchis sinensis]|uniref:Uncharacterized protein n=1 Tax=Clonorchis sinensis TaxID=79923 RepID=G7YEI5_CLOSI|nr:hypothetical protein CLF_105998 [Clonorchis sinensis]